MDTTHDKTHTTRTFHSVIEVDHTVGTDRSGDPERKVADMVATDSV